MYANNRCSTRSDNGQNAPTAIPAGKTVYSLFSRSAFFPLFGSALLCGMLICNLAHADPRSQAKRMHDRLTGVPPSASVLDQMENYISTNDAESAAFLAMDNSAFYNVTLKNFAAPWTNIDADVFVPLNDYSATVIGLVRDERDFREVLFEDVLYVADDAVGVAPYSNSNNTQYEQLEDRGADLKTALVARTQSEITGLNPAATAGVMTSRAAAQAFFIDGTNRAMFRFTLINHLCNDLEQVKDITRVPDRIRQDVTRSPGGDSRIFLNSCIGCHSGMDPLAQAFAYYNWEYDVDTDPDGVAGHLVYNDIGDIDPDTGSRVQKKYHINENNFQYGYVTPNDNWDNYWRAGQNALLGWDENLSGSGSGAKSMGQELAYSDAFAQCQVKKVFRNVCLRSPGTSADRNQISSMVTSFKQGYNMKQVFAEAAVYCMGDD